MVNPKIPEEQKKITRGVSLSREQIAFAMELGGGSFTRGIVRALENMEGIEDSPSKGFAEIEEKERLETLAAK